MVYGYGDMSVIQYSLGKSLNSSELMQCELTAYFIIVFNSDLFFIYIYKL